MNERHDDQRGDGGDDGRRPDSNRESFGKNPFMPSYSDVRSALLQIGVDITNPDSVEQFNEAVDEGRRIAKRRKWWSAAKGQIFTAVAASAITGLFGAIAAWWGSAHGSGGGH